jgi:hypothetical protein
MSVAHRIAFTITEGNRENNYSPGAGCSIGKIGIKYHQSIRLLKIVFLGEILDNEFMRQFIFIETLPMPILPASCRHLAQSSRSSIPLPRRFTL